MALSRIKPVPALGIIIGLMVALAFPPLLLVIPIVIAIVVRRKAKAYNDPQARAWREAQEWHRRNG